MLLVDRSDRSDASVEDLLVNTYGVSRRICFEEANSAQNGTVVSGLTQKPRSNYLMSFWTDDTPSMRAVRIVINEGHDFSKGVWISLFDIFF